MRGDSEVGEVKQASACIVTAVLTDAQMLPSGRTLYSLSLETDLFMRSSKKAES